MSSSITIEKKEKRSNEIIRRIKKTSYDSTFSYPLVIKNGYGCKIEDMDGKKFLDFTSNIASCPLGYSHSEILKVLKSFSTNGIHKIAGQDFYCEEHALIAEKLLSLFSRHFKTFLINSGAEAVENAIKLAYRRMGTLPGIACINAFHGRTLGALSFTCSKQVQKANFPELAVKRIKFCTDDNDAEVDSIEKLLRQNKISFIITEVIQGEGGVYVASKKFIQNIRKLSKRYGIPLIIDEVQSGLGRTGRWWAHQHYGISPDILSVAKGLQVGAVVYDKIFEPSDRGVLSSTWGAGSRIDMAIGAKIIQTIDADNLLENASKMGSILFKGLSEFLHKKVVVDVRGMGLMIGVEFDNTKNRDNIILQLFRNGLLVLPAGIKAIRVMPPLIITEREICKGLEIIDKVL